MNAIHAFLDGLIDYAGLFPPAGLDMMSAVRNYSTERSGENASMLGRFIVPMRRLAEFKDAFYEACCNEQDAPWLLSVLSTGNSEEDVSLLGKFSEGAAFVDALEVKAVDAKHAESTLVSLPSRKTVYVEFAPELCGRMLPVLKKHDARAKIRTGGTTPETILSVEQLAYFLVSSAKSQVAFKATAGLHHPLRSYQKLTYESNSPSGWMHGFINVFVAATIAYFGATEDQVIQLLNEQDSGAFRWSENALTWRDHQLSTKQIRTVREEFAIGFGSCSFTEPVDDLKAIGWL
jgi:hypothetical protein